MESGACGVCSLESERAGTPRRRGMPRGERGGATGRQIKKARKTGSCTGTCKVAQHLLSTTTIIIKVVHVNERNGSDADGTVSRPATAL